MAIFNDVLGRRPGVRIINELDPSLSIVSPVFRTVGIIGTSFPTLLVRNVRVIRGTAGTPDNIGTYGPGLVNSVLTVSSFFDAYGTNLPAYIEGTDYTVSDNQISWIAGGNQPAEGTAYFVTIILQKDASFYNNPTRYTNIEQVRAAFGPEFDGTTINQIVVASRIAFAAGTPSVIISEAASDSLLDVSDAIDSMSNSEIQYLLCVPVTTAGVGAKLMAHVVEMSSVEKSMRRLGMVCSIDPNMSVDDICSDAISYSEPRITYLAPPQVQILVSDQTGVASEQWVPAIYSGAAIFGLMANPNRPLIQGMTNQDLTATGILGISDKYMDSEIEKLAGSGVTVLFEDYNLVRVNQGVTTNTSNYAAYQLNVVAALDELSRIMQRALTTTFIGKPLLPGTPMDVQVFIKKQLDDLRGRLFNDYNTVTATRDNKNPLKINASARVAPTFSADYIDMIFTVTF